LFIQSDLFGAKCLVEARTHLSKAVALASRNNKDLVTIRIKILSNSSLHLVQSIQPKPPPRLEGLVVALLFLLL